VFEPWKRGEAVQPSGVQVEPAAKGGE